MIYDFLSAFHRQGPTVLFNSSKLLRIAHTQRHQAKKHVGLKTNSSYTLFMTNMLFFPFIEKLHTGGVCPAEWNPTTSQPNRKWLPPYYPLLMDGEVRLMATSEGLMQWMLIKRPLTTRCISNKPVWEHRSIQTQYTGKYRPPCFSQHLGTEPTRTDLSFKRTEKKI